MSTPVERTGSNEGAYWDGQWNEFKAAVAEESRQGWTPETIANTLKCDVEAVHAALAEIVDEEGRDGRYL